VSRRRWLSLSLLAMVLPVGAKSCGYAIHRPVHVNPEHPSVRVELTERARYLSARVPMSTAQMPFYLPDQFRGEWLAVTYSMTAMALANLAFLYPDTVSEAKEVLDRLARAMLEPEAREFDAARWGEDPLRTLDGANGHIGYLAHLQLVLLAHVYLGGLEHAPLAREVATALQRRMAASPSLHAETYPGETYVADNAVVVACLALTQRVFGDMRVDVTEPWVRRVRADYLDPDTGLMVFRLTGDGRVVEPSRGSGVGWSIFYLAYADRAFAAEQYGRMRDVLGSTALFSFVHGIREYPVGVGGKGDVDSGPVVLGLSPSGTGFAIAGATFTGDDGYKLELLRTAELVGTTMGTDGERRYVFAPLVGDAILLAMRTTTPWSLVFAGR
jgi:hypothetical protein